MTALRTVLGDVPAAEMGVTLAHEHLVSDSSVWLQPPRDDVGRRLADAEPALENLWWMRQHPNSNRRVVTLRDEALAVAELQTFGAHGGRTVVELTCSTAMGRDVEALARIARASGVNVVASTGHYIGASHAAWVAGASEQQLADVMVRELREGVDGTGIRCGVIGEIGLSWPIEEDERKVLHAAARAQAVTGAAITVHTAAHAVEEDSALDAADELAAAGADLTRVVMCHLDTSLHRLDYHRRVLERGCYVEYDLFGHELFESENGFQSYGDTERVRAVAALVAEGAAPQLLLSHDICYTIQLQRYGGYGYAHLLRNIRPRLELVGVPAATFEQLLVRNPRRLFAADW